MINPDLASAPVGEIARAHEATHHRLCVFYDGHCPVCCWEVDAYNKLDKSGRLRWIDIVALADDELPSGKDRQVLLNRFHVQDARGGWHVGVDAFAAIWAELPGFRHLAWLFRTPGIRQLAELGYRGFLKWQGWHRARR